MGKAKRLRSERNRERRERSAYARVWREMGWQLEQEQGSTMAMLTAKMARMMLPRSRVLRFRNWSTPALPLRELRQQLSDVRFPFPITFLDPGESSLGDGWVLTGILALEDRDALICPCRKEGTNDWMSPTLFLEHIQEWEGDGVSIPSPEQEPYSYPDDIGERLGKAAITMLAMLECANVEMLPALDPPSKGHIAHGVPHFDVVLRQAKTRREPPEEHRKVDWSHRWETMAHFKHIRHGPIFDAAPLEKRRTTKEHGEHVLVWCPSFVKGPPDKPLIPKIRTKIGAA